MKPTYDNAARARGGEVGNQVKARQLRSPDNTISTEFSSFAPLGNIVAEVVLASICRAKNVSRPVGRVMMQHAGMGALI